MMFILPAALTTESGTPSDPARLQGLILGVAAGDREALSQLYRQTRGAVYGLALSYLRHADDAQDVTQDTFVRIWDKAELYRPQGSPLAWILSIARSLALMRLREREKFLHLEEQAWEAIPAGSSLIPEDRLLLQTALETLRAQERQVIILRAAGLKHREIAALLELPLATVLSQYQRGLKKLRFILEGE